MKNSKYNTTNQSTSIGTIFHSVKDLTDPRNNELCENLRKYAFNAKSTPNGIIFYSPLFPNLSYNTHYDKDNNICTTLIHTTYKRKEHVHSVLSATKIVTLVIACILWIFSLLMVFSEKFNISTALLFFSFSVFPLVEAIKFLCLSKPKNGRLHSCAKYHSAEHQVINAYRKYNRIPTFKEVQNSSRFSRYCGSLNEINNIIYGLLMGILVLISPKLNPILYLIILIATLITLYKIRVTGHPQFMEIIYTVPASEKEIKLALVALENFFKYEEEFWNKIKKGESA